MPLQGFEHKLKRNQIPITVNTGQLMPPDLVSHSGWNIRW